MKYKLLRFSLLSMLVMFFGGLAHADYQKVTSLEGLTPDSEYLIVNETAGVALDGSLGTLDAANNTVSVSISGDVIASSDDVDAATFTISQTDLGYTIKSASGHFIGVTSYANGLKQTDEVGDGYYHAISFDGDDVVLKVTTSGGDMTMRYNKASNQNRFRYYKSGQEAVQLYKKVSGGQVDNRLPTTITLGEYQTTGEVSQTVSLPTATVSSADGVPLDALVEWESSNTDVATIAPTAALINCVAAGTTTIKATFAGDNNYKASSASYTFTVHNAAVNVKTFRELQYQANQVGNSATPATITFNGEQVVFVNGNNAYLADGQGFGVLIYTKDHGLEAGQTLTGTIDAKIQLYQGAAEITDFSKEGLTIGSADVVPVMKAISQIQLYNQSTLVTVKNATYSYDEDTKTATLTDPTTEASIVFYDKFKTNVAFEVGKSYDVTGIILPYVKNNETILEIAPRTADDVAETTAQQPAGFRDIRADLTSTALIPEGTTQWADVSTGIAVAEDGTLTRIDKEGAAIVFNGKWHGTQYGWANFSATVPVEGCVKITLGASNYGSGAVTVTNSEGAEVAKIDNHIGTMWSPNSPDNVAVGYYRTNAATTLTFSACDYLPYFAVEAIDEADLPAEVTEYTVTFTILGVDCQGVAPAEQTVEAGQTVKIPANATLYSEGRTLTQWSDSFGIPYNPGDEITVNSDMTLIPYFAENTVSLADRDAAVTLNFPLDGYNDNPQHKIERTTGIIVTQAQVKGQTIDVKVDVDATNGKFSYNGSGWHQVNSGTKVTVPSCKDAVIKVKTYNNANGLKFGETAAAADEDPATFTATADDATLVIEQTSNGYWSNLNIMLPKATEGGDPQPHDPVVLTWDYTEEKIPTKGPDRGLYYAAYVNDAPSTNNGMNGVKLNSSGWAYFEKPAVAGTLTLTFGNRKTADAYAVNVSHGTLENDKGVKGDLIGEVSINESPGTGSIDLGADVTGIYIDRKTTSEGVLQKIVFKEFVPRSFKDFEIPYATLTADGYTGADLPAGVTFSGSFHDGQHGYSDAQLVVPVDGTVKFTISGCRWGNSYAVKNAEGETLATINQKDAGCYNYDAPGYNTYIYTGDPTTLTFGPIGYLSYFKAEATEVSEVTITYKDQNGAVLGTKTVFEGDPVGEIPYTEADLTIPEGEKFRGWVYNTGIKVKATDPVNGNISISASVTAIEADPEVGSIQTYDLTKATFYPEDHENFNVTDGNYYNEHGFTFNAGGSFDVKVAGKAQIVLTLCQYGNGTTITVTDAQGNVVRDDVPAKADADGGTTAVNYDGPATTLTFTFAAQSYLHKVMVYNVNGFVEKDMASGYYIVEPGDAAGLVLAINAAASEDGAKIFLPNGTYDLGEAVLTGISGNNVSIVGQSMEGVTVKNAPPTSMEGLEKADLFLNTGTGLYLQDLTLQNALDYYGAGSAGRAPTLHDKGTKTINKNVRHLSYQDTYYSHKVGGLYYFEGGEIHGTVDYVCGNGRVYFNEVKFVNEQRSTATIAANSELYVFNNCTVENNANSWNLGRAWSDNPVCIYLNTTLMDPDKLIATRWNLSGINCDFSVAGEYGTKNAAGEDITPAENIITFTKQNTTMNTILTADQAAKYTANYVLGDWATEAQNLTKQVDAPAAQMSNGAISWSEVDGATAYAIFKNGVLLGITKETTFDTEAIVEVNSSRAANADTYTIRAANSRGGFGEPQTVSVATAISTANTLQDSNAIYNMQGVRVEKAQKGVYIVNGRKVVIK